jgi:molybdenum-dependent DNA-binding transcriptional regulator ModE
MDRLGDMRLFTEAAALGSLSAAGRKLGLSPAAASARLLKLEKSLTARLFERTTRQLRLTDEGRLYLQHCQIALQAIDDGEAALHAGQNLVRGKVRISATSDFGRNLLCHWLDEFSRVYPDVSFSLTLSDSVSNLLLEDIDLAIRFNRPPDGNLVARRLAPNRRVLCASPEYLARHGEPKTPADLATHTFTVLVTSTATFNGCQMNEYDSDKMADVLHAADGYEKTDDVEQADLVLYNSCSVREKAAEKMFSDLGRIKHLKAKGVLIGVGGCVASQEGAAIVERAPYVDLVFGPQTLHRLPR